jgi:hypothetical protein
MYPASPKGRPELPFWPMLFNNVIIRLLGQRRLPQDAKQAGRDLTDAATQSALSIAIATENSHHCPFGITNIPIRTVSGERWRLGVSGRSPAVPGLSPYRRRHSLGAGRQGRIPSAHYAGVPEGRPGELQGRPPWIRAGADVIGVQNVLAQG